MREQLTATKPALWRNKSFFPRVQVRQAAGEVARTSSTHKPVKMETDIMNRLPCFDRTTRRSEAAVFASLGLAGIISISFATSAFMKFVGGSDRVVQALTNSPYGVAGKTPEKDAPATLTNITVFQGRRTTPKPAAPGKV